MNTEVIQPETGEVVATLPAVDHNSVRQQVNDVQRLMQSVMQQDTHYGVIPGCGKKPALFKAGAEKLAMACGFSAAFEVTRSDLANDHREYTVKCSLTLRNGQFVCNGYGSCSTMERKYRYRTEWNQGQKASIENEDIADTFNTVLKMAKKRAYVDAVLTATGASDLFTQDIEEGIPAPDDTPHTATPSPSQQAPPPQPPRQSSTPPPAQQQSAPADGGGADPNSTLRSDEIEGQIKTVSVTISEAKELKSGQGNNGPWSLYGFITPSGYTFTSFSDSDMQAFAQEGPGKQWEVTYIPSMKGKYAQRSIQRDGLRCLEPSQPAADPDRIPDDEIPF